MRRVATGLLGLILLVIGQGYAWAIGLGPIHVYSNLGQVFHAEVDIINSKAIPLSSLSAKLSPSQQFKAMSLANVALGHELTTKLMLKDDQQPVLDIKSRQPMSLPFIEFNIRLQWPGGEADRVYSIFVNPVNNQVKPIQQQRKVLPNLPTQFPGEDTATTNIKQSYGPVQAHETLWSISKKIKPQNAKIEQVMIALYQANLKQFIDQHYSEIRQGVYLQIPSDQRILSINPTWTLASHLNEIQNAAKDKLPNLITEQTLPAEASFVTAPSMAEKTAIKTLQQQLRRERKRNAVLQAQLNKLESDVARIAKNTDVAKQDVSRQPPTVKSSGLMAIMKSMLASQKQAQPAAETVVEENYQADPNNTKLAHQQINRIMSASLQNTTDLASSKAHVSQTSDVSHETNTVNAEPAQSYRNTYLIIALLVLVILFLWNKRRQNLQDDDSDDQIKPKLLNKFKQIIKDKLQRQRQSAQDNKPVAEGIDDSPANASMTTERKEHEAALAHFSQKAGELQKTMKVIEQKGQQAQAIDEDTEVDLEDEEELASNIEEIEPVDSVEDDKPFEIEAGDLADKLKEGRSTNEQGYCGRSTVIGSRDHQAAEEDKALDNNNELPAANSELVSDERVVDQANHYFTAANNLALAQTYVDMSDFEEAEALLAEVIKTGNSQQKQQAEKIRASYQQTPPDES